ncbi:hypothetical protein BaRGS_00020834, partial [Batillaria attramentaria]
MNGPEERAKQRDITPDAKPTSEPAGGCRKIQEGEVTHPTFAKLAEQQSSIHSPFTAGAIRTIEQRIRGVKQLQLQYRKFSASNTFEQVDQFRKVQCACVEVDQFRKVQCACVEVDQFRKVQCACVEVDQFRKAQCACVEFGSVQKELDQFTKVGCTCAELDQFRNVGCTCIELDQFRKVGCTCVELDQFRK